MQDQDLKKVSQEVTNFLNEAVSFTEKTLSYKKDIDFFKFLYALKKYLETNSSIYRDL